MPDEMSRGTPHIGALIFDMDGVIVDSNPVHREAWRLFNLRHGIETTEAMQERMYGKHNAAIVRDFFGAELSDAEVLAHGAAKEALYRGLMGEGIERTLVPGVREFIARHADLPMGLGTNADPENVQFVLAGLGLTSVFRAVVDGDQVQKPKPDPEIYLKVSSLLQVAPEACVVFEDSFSGIAAARSAGMQVVGIRTTHRELPGVALAIDDFRSPELERWIAVR